jgi:hypothetical protein
MKQPELGEFLNVYFAYSLATCVVLLMILILWEEILFPIKVRPVTGGHIDSGSYVSFHSCTHRISLFDL